MKKYVKLIKHISENIDKFLQSLMDKPVFDKGLVLPDKLICLSKTRVPNARGMLMPSPQGRDKIANAPPLGLTTWANAPRLPGGMGTAGIDWCITGDTLPFDLTPCFWCLDWMVFLPNYKENSKQDKCLRLTLFWRIRNWAARGDPAKKTVRKLHKKQLLIANTEQN